MASAGYAYTYASRSLGKGAGFMAGWLYSVGLICFVPMTMAGVAYLAVRPDASVERLVVPAVPGRHGAARRAVHHQDQGDHVHPAGRRRTDHRDHPDRRRRDHRKGGAHGNTASVFSFGHTNKGGFSGVFYGIIFGITSYIGFETAADFGEETANPRRNIPIAVIASVGFAILFYVWTTYSLTIGYGVNHGAKFGADPTSLKTVADQVRRWPAADAARARSAALGVLRLRRLRHRRHPHPVRDGS